MKINIGSGRDYRAGYENADPFNPNADASFSAHCMDFPDECAEEILAAQIIEHLGFFKAVFFLAEAYRILRPDGRLVIETPDIAEAFARFGGAARAGRERLLQWIYGLETAGMGHVFCFPEELLAEKLRAQGFEIKAVERFEAGTDNPAVRVIAEKTESRDGEMLFCRFRRRLAVCGLADFSEETLSSETEALVTRLRNVAAPDGRLVDLSDGKVFASCLYESACCAPAVSVFFRTLENAGLSPGIYLRAALILEGGAFSARCEREFLAIPPAPLSQDAAFAKTAAWSRAAIDRILAGKSVCEACSSCGPDLLGEGAHKKRAKAFFSQKMLSLKAQEEFSAGLKAASCGDYHAALSAFELSAGYYRDCPDTYINLAYCAAALGMNQQSERWKDCARQCGGLRGDAEVCLSVPWRGDHEQ
ncbi:MAG: hypothetical protein WC421_05665 [Elusimicrobiales bacterium]